MHEKEALLSELRPELEDNEPPILGLRRIIYERNMAQTSRVGIFLTGLIIGASIVAAIAHWTDLL